MYPSSMINAYKKKKCLNVYANKMVKVPVNIAY